MKKKKKNACILEKLDNAELPFLPQFCKDFFLFDFVPKLEYIKMMYEINAKKIAHTHLNEIYPAINMTIHFQVNKT